MDPGRAGTDVTVVEGPEELPATVDGPPSGPSEAPPVLPGQMVGRYEVLAVLGKGGMGSVFTAHDPDLDRTVAIKLLHAGIDDQRLEREARALARVSHPNVIAVYDVGRSQGRLFVAMEFVEGVTLRRWLVTERRSFDAILSVFSQAGRGLEAAHAAGLVHRDFKPDNVLLGHDGRVRVLDFGLVGGVSGPVDPSISLRPQSPAFEDDSSSGGARLTENGSLIGTPAYMALEQYSAAAPDPRTDQFSFCVALWEALYGRRPYDSKSVVELLERLRSGTPPEAPRNSDVPLWLERIVRRGLSRQLDARFPSMGELLSQLEASSERARARDRLIGYRYRPLASGGEGGAALDTFTDQQVELVPTARPLDFELLGSFEHPNLVPVTDVALAPSGGAHFLVLDLAQPRKTFEEAQQGAPLAIQLEWLSELLRAFLYLHRRGIGHAATSPTDVLIVGGRLRLLVTTIDTFRPEASVSRDLAFVGALSARLAGLSPALEGFVRSLSAPRGAGQFADAAAALLALGRAAERPFAVENTETRESLLRALPLLGRSAVVETLHDALNEGLSGRGSAFFIEGESGVGKSRLLEELRRAAVARGVIVLEGRGEASDRSPYRVFRLPLLRLSLRAGSEALDDFQFEVLTPLIPELPARLGRAAAPSVAADAQSKRDALSAVVVSLLRQQREPLLLLLEDLQWSGSESFALLSELVSLCEHQPLIIVCGCRSEERAACPPLPAGMRSLSLQRLSEGDIAEACARLIDGDEPAPKELVALLSRETEGNAFFLVEALRALAEEAGSLSALKAAALPARIFTGGIQTLIRRHLAAISEGGRPLLRAAAVAGRTADPALLRALEPATDVEAWIAECVAAAVLERIDAGRELGIRFRHDKLREALLDELEPAERRALHARVASALEQTRADDPSQLAPLARHFQAAGNEEKELEFAAQAGEQALYSRAYTEAAEFLERAITLSQRASRRELLPQLYALRAELHAQRSEWSAAQHEIATVFRAAGRPLWERRLGEGFFLFVQLLVHLFRSLLPASSGPTDAGRAARSRALVRAADVQLNIALSRGDNLLALGSSFLALNVGERGRNSSVRALFLVALAAKVARLRGVTRRYIARANELLPLTSDRKDLSEALSYSGLYWIGEGKLGRAREQLLRSVEASTSIGYQQPLAWSLGQLSMCASLRGKFAEMLEQAEVCERETIAGEPTQVAARCTQTLALIRLGRLDEAKQRLATLNAPSPSESPLTLAIRAATAARLALAQGELPAAVTAADEVHRILPWVSQVPPVWPDVLTAPLEVYLSAWQTARDTPAGAARFSSVAKRRVRALEGWSRLYPVARPIADYFSGRAQALLGDYERAAVLLERAHEGARARSLAHYAAAAGEALAELRKPRQTSAI